VVIIRKAVRNIDSVEKCDRNIRSKKMRMLRLEGEINDCVNVINETLIRKRQITNNSQFTFLDGFDVKEKYKEIDFSGCKL